MDFLKPHNDHLSRRTRRRIAREQLLRGANIVNTIQVGNNLTSNTNNGRSGFWSDCPFDELKVGSDRGFAFEDDFLTWPLPGTQTTEITLDKYKVYCATAGKWIADSMPHSSALVTPVIGQTGVISGLCDTDEDAMAIGTQQCPILLTTTQTGKVWFEARVATTSILTTMGHWFIGLCENVAVTFGAATPLDDDNATATGCAMIGFNRLESGLSVLNTSYADHAAAWTDIQATASTGVLAANTWIKLGIKVDMKDTARCVRFYVNNIECSTAMTKAALLALTHVDVKPLGPCIAFVADSGGTACYTYLDYWAWAQLF